MVSIIPQETQSDILGRMLGQGLAENLPRGLEKLANRTQLQQSLERIKGISNDPNASPLDITLGVLQAGAGIPGSERYMAQVLPQILQIAQARRSQETPHAADYGSASQRTHETVEQPTQRMAAPNFLNRQEAQDQFFPSNLGGNSLPGNVPQAATSGQVRPDYSDDELIPMARDLSIKRTKAGIPTTVPQAFEELKANREENRLYNQRVETERQQRVDSQTESGERAANELVKLMPEATSEQKAIFQKKGEMLRQRNLSEADFNRAIALEARNFKNNIENIKRDLSAPRTQNDLQRKFWGTEKDFNQASKDLKVKLDPLLKEGLYDTARTLLMDLGYYPEERDSIINPFSERTQDYLNNFPKAGVKAFPGKGMTGLLNVPKIERVYSPDSVNKLKSAIKDIWNHQSNISPVLLRKAFEDKGYDWRTFKDAWNDLVLNGEIQQTDDQRTQSGYLDSPPLNSLDRILHGLNLIGR